MQLQKNHDKFILKIELMVNIEWLAQTSTALKTVVFENWRSP